MTECSHRLIALRIRRTWFIEEMTICACSLLGESESSDCNHYTYIHYVYTTRRYSFEILGKSITKGAAARTGGDQAHIQMPSTSVKLGHYSYGTTSQRRRPTIHRHGQPRRPRSISNEVNDGIGDISSCSQMRPRGDTSGHDLWGKRDASHRDCDV